MNEETADVVVVGVGIVGAATAWALARRGVDVVALERFHIGHARGSSHGTSRIFRFSYHDPMYVGMAREALGLWRQLEDAVETPLIRSTGGLDLGKNLEAHTKALETHGVPFESLTGEEAMARWAYLAMEPDERVLYQQDAGICLAEEAWHAFVEEGRRAGAAVQEGVTVTSIEPGTQEVKVHTEDATVTAKSVVVTAGPWVNDLLGPLSLGLQVDTSLETVAFFEMDEALEVPSLVDWGRPAFYSLASPSPAGLKVGLHHAGPHVHPDDPAEPSVAAIETIITWVRTRFPSADAVPMRVDTCFYTNTPDEHFILSRHGDIVVGSACSGHGFKFAPLHGERLADLALSTGP